MNSRNIFFVPGSEEVEKFVPPPSPAKLSVPDWYKREQTDYLKSPEFNETGELINTSMKQCVPFLDAMTAGYVQKTWCDIYVDFNSEETKISFASSPEPMGYRDKAHLKFKYDEYYPIEFYWQIPWSARTTDGYSVFAMHPLNRYDLPFTTLAGFIDSDGYHHAPFGNMPFYIKKGFSGLIPKGTPMYQFVPVKRESWNSSPDPFDDNLAEKRIRSQISRFWGFYKDNFWQKKSYN